MNKIIKWSAILGIIFFLLGIGVTTAGAMMGGADEVGAYMQRFGGYCSDDSFVVEPEFGINRVAPGGGPGTAPIAPGGDDGMETVTYEHVEKLKVEAGPGEVFFQTEDRQDPQDTSIRVETYGVDGVLTWSYDIRQEEDELKIERNHEFENIVGLLKNHSDDYRSKRMETLVIYLPEAYRFREVEIEAAASSVTVDEIYADKLELELTAGELTVNYGAVGNLDAQCRAGSMYIGLEGKKEQYDYELSCSAGSLILADEEEETFSGLHREQQIDHNAGKKAELECDAGELFVQFTDTEL